ncbi:hypothetical protein NDU88_002063 [Pleurodeles waltl]|uniref:Uncharacterized protein n=1 Tax=Pleurodeles waltl TaxID=8319 RepID=A0AAV7REF1_PLEWA|nr:hypothetical protein NDU88_002063 [Pleurodeles waltl]
MNGSGRAKALWRTDAADITSKEDGAMAENRGQGQRRGTAPKNKGRHQEEVERPTGEGTPANVTGEEVAPLSSPPKEEAHSDDGNFVPVDLEDLPGPSGATGQPVTPAHSETTKEPLPSGTNTTSPTQRSHTSVPRTRQSALCPPVQGPKATPRPQDNQGPGVSGSGHTVQGTEAQAVRDTGRTAVSQGEDRSREPILQEALSEILGAYQHSQDTMGQILDNVQENRQLQEGPYHRRCAGRHRQHHEGGNSTTAGPCH